MDVVSTFRAGWDKNKFTICFRFLVWCLQAINARRKRHHDTDKLVWDDNIADNAQSWAEELLEKEKLAFDPENAFLGYGESHGFIRINFNNLRFVCERIIKIW